MAIDMVALKAKLAAAAAANKIAPSTSTVVTIPEEKKDETHTSGMGSTGSSSTEHSNMVATVSIPVSEVTAVAIVTVPAAPAPALTSTDVVGTAKTSEIDHLDFLHKMNLLQEAIHTQHPTMPVLLMQIHKQLRADPELTSTLSEEGIGVIVKGLQLQTKTELVSVVIKESKSKKKKEPISLDMF